MTSGRFRSRAQVAHETSRHFAREKKKTLFLLVKMLVHMQSFYMGVFVVVVH